MESISIIRDRGQITIPDTIRKAVGWARPSSVVSIAVVTPDEIVIRPHGAPTNPQEVWRLIDKARSTALGLKKRKKMLSTAEFLKADRQSH